MIVQCRIPFASRAGKRARRVDRIEPRETELVRSILELLRLRGVVAWRQNSGAARIPREDGSARFVRFASIRGISDIVGILPSGRFLAVECKIGKNDLTAEQRDFLEMVERNGGAAFVARDVGIFAEELDRCLAGKGKAPNS
jgi:VRR-NUC domain